MRNGATTWRDHDRARNVSESRISQASEADLSGPLPMSALGQSLQGRPSGKSDHAGYAPKSGSRFRVLAGSRSAIAA